MPDELRQYLIEAALVQLMATEIGFVNAPPPIFAEQLIEDEFVEEPPEEVVVPVLVGVVSAGFGFGGVNGIIGPGKGPSDLPPAAGAEAVLPLDGVEFEFDELLDELLPPVRGTVPFDEGPGVEPA